MHVYLTEINDMEIFTKHFLNRNGKQNCVARNKNSALYITIIGTKNHLYYHNLVRMYFSSKMKQSLKCDIKFKKKYINCAFTNNDRTVAN